MSAEIRRSGGTLTVHLAGDWELVRTAPRFGLLLGEGAHPDPVTRQDPARAPEVPIGAIDFDATDLGRWDSSLLTFLLQVMRHADAHDLDFGEQGLPEDIVRLLELARVVPDRGSDRAPPTASAVARIGARGVIAYDALRESVTFLGEVAGGFVRLAAFRLRLRWRDFWVVVQANSTGALPIVTLIAFLVGMIIAFLGAVVLRRFGAGYFVSYLVGYGMLREMASLMTGIIMAGRTGAGFAAELGSMKISEEIDAYRTLGISPVHHLVLPRVLGVLVTMPLLTIYAGFVGILGGMVVATTVLDLSVTQFMGGLLTAVTLSDGLLGVFKGTVFGLIIGVAGCMRGMEAGTDASAVGRAATSAVVLGITLIIGANAAIDWLAVLLDI
ncbi:MAG: ABC transporter permease [Longimicrobiales bacterium]|nr:ABC transporter permease [Longimicrobiales bacterium]